MRFVGALVVAAVAHAATLSNNALPVDQNGASLLTGEVSVMAYNGSYYLYLNNWGGCVGLNCCEMGDWCVKIFDGRCASPRLTLRLTLRLALRLPAPCAAPYAALRCASLPFRICGLRRPSPRAIFPLPCLAARLAASTHRPPDSTTRACTPATTRSWPIGHRTSLPSTTSDKPCPSPRGYRALSSGLKSFSPPLSISS